MTLSGVNFDDNNTKLFDNNRRYLTDKRARARTQRYTYIHTHTYIGTYIDSRSTSNDKMPSFSRIERVCLLRNGAQSFGEQCSDISVIVNRWLWKYRGLLKMIDARDIVWTSRVKFHRHRPIDRRDATSACRCKLNSRKIGAGSKRINEIGIRIEIATKKYFTTDDCNSFVQDRKTRWFTNDRRYR